MHHAHANEIYGQQKEIRAIAYYHQHHRVKEGLVDEFVRLFLSGFAN